MDKNASQFKYRVLQLLTAFVYRQVDKRRDAILEQIIDKNDIAYNRQALIFNYGGKRWTRHTFRGLPPKVPFLAGSLHEAMDEYIKEGEEIELREKPMVQAYIRAILNSDPDPAVALMRVPTALHSPIREAINEAVESTGKPANYTFEQAQELVGAYAPAADAIRKRMMVNMMME